MITANQFSYYGKLGKKSKMSGKAQVVVENDFASSCLVGERK